MKRFTNVLSGATSFRKLMLLISILVPVTELFSQEKPAVKGMLLEQKTMQAVPYAAVALIRVSDSSMMNGAVSDENGLFTISPVVPGIYRLRVSTIGYKPAVKNVVAGPGITDAGTIFLQDTAMLLQELMIVSDKVKAKSEGDKTTFFMTKKMLDAAGNGMDVIKLIPGIQVDFMQTISLDGGRSIQVFVDGKERDGSFLGQVDPRQIEKIEVISKPTANCDGNSTGAINIILKKEKSSGISGQINAEIPASGSEIYLRPDYMLNWGLNKLNLWTSYKGEMTYLDLRECSTRKAGNGAGITEITSSQLVRQKDWSHRFNLGFDFVISTRDQLDFYAFYNPYSRELDGTAYLQVNGSPGKSWQAGKEDTDRNSGTFSSLYYKHHFKPEGCDLAIEVSNYHLNAKNSTEYIPEGNGSSIPLQTNIAEPRQNVMSIKIDYLSRIGKKLDFSAGVKGKFQELQDKTLPGFEYDEKTMAAYGTLAYSQKNYFLNLGLRAEESVTLLKNSFRNPLLSLFPDATTGYKITLRQTIRIAYSRSIKRPNSYQLLPVTSIDDPYTAGKGNPCLQPEFRNSLFLEYSVQFKTSYFASRIFCNQQNRVISNLTFINDTGIFETQVHNLGTLRQFGIQLSGTFRIGILTINPFVQVFEQSAFGNRLAKQYGIENRDNLAYNSSLSAILSFPHEFSLSLVFRYASPENSIQGNSFSGALYFLSLEKTFKQKIRIGVVSALPFTKSFTYRGSATEGPNFSSHYEGNVQLSNPFCWLNLSYLISNGKKKEFSRPATEEMDNLPKKGF